VDHVPNEGQHTARGNPVCLGERGRRGEREGETSEEPRAPNNPQGREGEGKRKVRGRKPSPSEGRDEGEEISNIFFKLGRPGVRPIERTSLPGHEEILLSFTSNREDVYFFQPPKPFPPLSSSEPPPPNLSTNPPHTHPFIGRSCLGLKIPATHFFHTFPPHQLSSLSAHLFPP